MTKTKAEQASEIAKDVQEQVDELNIIDAIKELTKQQVELTKIIKEMKATHDKWVRAGKF